MTILVEVTQTARAMGRNQEWCRYNNATHRFTNEDDALNWIDANYSNKRGRKPIFVDTKSRGTIQSGWIYSGKDNGNYTQDWVTLSEVLSETERTAQSLNVKTIKRAA